MNQKQRILNLLKERGSLTNIELNGIAYRYAARIDELRSEGHPISEARYIGPGKFRYYYEGLKDDLFSTAQAIKEAEELISDRQENEAVASVPEKSFENFDPGVQEVWKTFGAKLHAGTSQAKAVSRPRESF